MPAFGTLADFVHWLEGHDMTKTDAAAAPAKSGAASVSAAGAAVLVSAAAAAVLAAF